jgi:hypothetical protein
VENGGVIILAGYSIALIIVELIVFGSSVAIIYRCVHCKVMVKFGRHPIQARDGPNV